MTARRPAPAFAMRRRQRVTGEQFLVAIVDEQVVLEPGAELHLVRIRAGAAGSEPTHALRVVPPAVAVTRRQLAAAARDRLDGSAVRLDPRDQTTRPIPARSTP